MTKIKILQVSATNKKKDGSEMPNNTLKVGLKTLSKDGQEVWLNGIVEKDAMTFAEGQEVELEIEQTQYGLSFKAPTLASIINSLDNRVRKLEMQNQEVKPQYDFKKQDPDMADLANDPSF